MTATTAAELGGPTLPQVRRLGHGGARAAVAGAGRAALGAVSAGVGSVMPVYAAAAGGGVVVDVDGNSFIDLGSGIAVTTVGNSAPAVVDAVRDQVAAFTHTCFMVTPYDGYVAVCRGAQRDHPGPTTRSARRCSTRCGGGGERREGRAAGHAAPAVACSTTPTTAARRSRWR
jgi:4-aminobutyrate aminotransferase/(S)-3-amino-2-methylpropionate transaminase